MVGEVGEVGERGLEGGEEEVEVHPRQLWGVHRWWGGEGAGGRVRPQLPQQDTSTPEGRRGERVIEEKICRGKNDRGKSESRGSLFLGGIWRD